MKGDGDGGRGRIRTYERRRRGLGAVRFTPIRPSKSLIRILNVLKNLAADDLLHNLRRSSADMQQASIAA